MGASSDLLIFKMRGVPAEEAEKTEAAEKPQKVIGYLEPPKPVEIEAEAKVEEKKVEKGERWGEVKPEPTSIYYKEGGDYPNPVNFYKEAVAQNEGVVVTEAPRGKADSREQAKGLFCAAHPARHAYAVCAYCHRPFCFEDIVEYKKDFYCIGDIDRVESHYSESLSNEYSTSSLITSIILIVGFLVYIYYSGGQLAYIFNYIISDFRGFMAALNLSYLLAIASLGSMLLTLVGALYILIGSRQSHILAALVSMVAVVLFVYQYVGTRSPYFAIIAGVEVVAFLAAVNSAASEALAYNQVYEKGPDYTLAFGLEAKF